MSETNRFMLDYTGSEVESLLEKAGTAVQPDTLNLYRTASAQNAIDSDKINKSNQLIKTNQDQRVAIDSDGRLWVSSSGGGGGTDANAVHYTAETKTSSEKTQARINIGAGTYSKPSGGIPEADLKTSVQTSLSKADGALQLAKQATKTSEQTQAVGVDSSGKLWVKTSSGGSSSASDISITDSGSYYTSNNVEGALQELGAELSGINTLLGSGVIQ